MAGAALDNPDFYLNRELGWLAFNRRVLEEAGDETNPLLERVKFLAIGASNLDEFFEVRVAALLQQIESGYTEPGPDGIPPAEVIQLIAADAHDLVTAQYRCWNERLRPALAAEGILIRSIGELDPEARAYIDQYCERELDPLLTPVTIDPAHPFPRVINKALCLALLLKRKRRATPTYLGVITVPRALPRLIHIPTADNTTNYVFLADLVALYAARMYRGFDILSEAAFRITRNSNLYLQEEESRNLLESVRSELHNRRKGDAVRLEIETDANAEIIENLRSNFDLAEWQVFRTEGPVSLVRLMHIYDDNDRADLKFKSFVPREMVFAAQSRTIFDEIRRRDILLHHPFDSYDAVVDFIEEAAEDPDVLSIKQTLYRTGNRSPIIDALTRAAAHKEVTAVVELKARFDEASNIRWARQLEDAGVQVFHGLVGLKTHCKLALVVRREEDGSTRRYAHLGTGNYNPTTARSYTDLSLLTTDERFTFAVHNVFNYLTAYAQQPSYDPLLVSPLDLAERTLALIAREAEHAYAGRPARIIAKMNALLDKSVIQELYRASEAGVEIDLIVRGMCALRPGVRRVSSRIRVRSIVGRFLEHSRIFYFENGGRPEIYVGSADWMPRNLYERVEVVFPVDDPTLHNRLLNEILSAYLADTCKARVLRSDGTYVRAAGRALPDFTAQKFLVDVAEARATGADIPRAIPSRARRTRVRSRK
jgi:polyphosphate kinase